MAKLTMHKWLPDHIREGTLKLLKEECGLSLDDAMKTEKAVLAGKPRTLEVPFLKMETLKSELKKRGWVVS